jgi:pimeloyl-ACP methyl ester carboxylesterase
MLSKIIPLTCLLLTLCASARAETWSDASGKFQVEAEFVKLEGEEVHLQKPDGQALVVPLSKLSTAAQERAKRLAMLAEAAAVPQTAAVDAKETKATSAPAPSAAEKPAMPPARTGQYSTSLEHHHPLAASRTIMPRMLGAGAQRTAAEMQKKLGQALPDFLYKISEETFQVYVPDDYDGRTPYGLMVFINSGDNGGPPKDWLPALKKHRLIFIGANKSGNDEDPVLRRGALALDAAYNMAQIYRIDADRVYICGNSGGGRNASWLALTYPDVFTGGQFHIGANPHACQAPASRQTHRYVFITCDKDFNREEMQSMAQSMVRDGYRYITYLQVPDKAHDAPSGEWFEKGLTALDQPLVEASELRFKQGLALFEKKQWGKALPLLRAAAAHGHSQPFAAEANAKLDEMQLAYDGDVTAIEAAIEQGQAAQAAKLLAEFRKRWAEAGVVDSKRLAIAAQKAAKR